MNRLGGTAVSVIALLLLTGILVALIYLARFGMAVNVSGEVALTNTATGITGDVRLFVDQPLDLVATGPDAGPIPAVLAPISCPACGGTMVPVRWRPLTGEIDWRCVDCGEVLFEDDGGT